MKTTITFLLLHAVVFQNPLIGGDEPRMVRFYAGEVLRAELKPDDDSIKIVNVNKFAPRSRVTADVGYAIVTVRPDKGRSLGIYDYSLVNSRKDVFPCVAIMNSFGEFDASLRELIKTKPNELYNLLFRIEMPSPPMTNLDFTLRFNLIPGKGRDPVLHFVNVGHHPFTKTSRIPLDGMLGVVPNWPKPKHKPKPKTIAKTAMAGKKKAGKNKKTITPAKKTAPHKKTAKK